MIRQEISKRLIWIELRRGYFMIPALILLPMTFSLYDRFPHGTPAGGSAQLLVGIVAIGLPFLVALWAADKAQQKEKGEDFLQSHLPLSTLSAWKASFLGPVIIVTIGGVWFGYWWSAIDNWQHIPATALMGAVSLSLCFQLPYLIASLISLWAAVLVGGFMAISVGGALTIAGIDPSLQMLKILTVASAGTLMAAVCLPKFSGHTPLRTKRYVLLLPAIAFLAALWTESDYLRQDKWPPSETHRLGIRDSGAITVRFGVVPVDGDAGYNVLWGFHLANANTEKVVVRRDFRHNIGVYAVADKQVYLSQQLPDEELIRILKWDIEANEVEQVATMPATRDLLRYRLTARPGPHRNHVSWGDNARDLISKQPYGGHGNIWVSPDRRYLLMVTAATLGTGFDLWAVNLEQGHGQVALPNSLFPTRTIVWSENHVTLSGPLRAVIVDLASMKASLLPVPRGGD